VSGPGAVPDRAERAADAGMWLFTASLVMLMASLVSGYVLLRTGSTLWPMPWRRGGFAAVADPWFRLLWLALAASTARAAWRGTPDPRSWLARYPLPLSAIAGAVFVARTVSAGVALVGEGHGPASHVAPATWFALNGVVAALATGGVMATAAVALAATGAVRSRRAELLFRYWAVVTLCFTAIAIGMYLI
jgi:heme/copper-type cytochrome/quinol oxidase subunit 3